MDPGRLRSPGATPQSMAGSSPLRKPRKASRSPARRCWWAAVTARWKRARREHGVGDVAVRERRPANLEHHQPVPDGGSGPEPSRTAAKQGGGAAQPGQARSRSGVLRRASPLMIESDLTRCDKGRLGLDEINARVYLLISCLSPSSPEHPEAWAWPSPPTSPPTAGTSSSTPDPPSPPALASTRWPATSPIPPTAPPWSRPPRRCRRARPAGRTTPAPSARRRCPRWPSTRSTSWPTSTPPTSSPRSGWCRRRCRYCAGRRPASSSTSPPTPPSSPYETWGGYGSSKAALDQVGRVLAAEEPGLRVYAFDPGDMPRDAPGRLPRRGHLRPADAGVGRAGAAGAAAGGAAQRSLPGLGRGGAGPMTAGVLDRLTFDPPARAQAEQTPEAAGLTRDGVRMLVARRSSPYAVVTHSTFALLPAFLDAGDLVVVNTSRTPVQARHRGRHRRRRQGARAPVDEARRRSLEWSSPGDRPSRSTERWCGELPQSPWLQLGPGDHRRVEGALRRRPAGCGSPGSSCPARALTWLAVHNRPIRYGYVERPWPITAYQNVYAAEPGSAGDAQRRPAVHPRGAHAVGGQGRRRHAARPPHGVASLEADELPYRSGSPSAVTAERVAAARASGRRGHRRQGPPWCGRWRRRSTTTASLGGGPPPPPPPPPQPYEGWTDLIITPERGVRAVDGLLDRVARARGRRTC